MTNNYIPMLALLLSFVISAQETAETPDANKDKYAPITIKLNEDGSKYMRFIFWTQVQAGTKNIGAYNYKTVFNLRRLRLLTFGQFSPKFLYVFHIGTHSYNAENANIGGKGAGDVFINDAWGEYMLVDKKLYIGAGLHYWGGISRLQRGSTFKYLTMDNANSSTWLNYGRSGAFVREFGVYAKGTLGKLQYAVSVNDALNSYAATGTTSLSTSTSKYAGAYIANKLNEEGARFNYTARLEYQLWDTEGDKLPFKTGNSLSKSANIFNLGAGIWLQPKAAVIAKNISITPTVDKVTAVNQITFENATHFAIDAFLEKNGITAYALYMNNNYGENAGGSRFTGAQFTGMLGYLLTDNKKINLQPYIGYNYLNPEYTTKAGGQLKIGVNLLHLGHSLKTTLEYQNNKALGVTKSTNNFYIQMQFMM